MHLSWLLCVFNSTCLNIWQKKKILSCICDFSVDLFTFFCFISKWTHVVFSGLFLLLTVVKLQAQKCVTAPAFNKRGRADQFCFSPTMFAACQKATACRKGWNASRWHGADMRSKDNFSPNQGRSDQNKCVEWSFQLTPVDTYIFFWLGFFPPIIYLHIYITHVQDWPAV